LSFYFIFKLDHKQTKNRPKQPKHLVKPDWWSHGGFDVERSNILPLLLQQTNQEIDGHVDVLDQLVVVHLHVTNGNGQTKNFLHLEFNGSFHLLDFSDHIVSLSQNTWKLTGFVQTWSEQSWDLPDQSIGGQESVVFFRKFFDELFVFVELFQVIDGHVWDVVFGGFIDMRLVSENANGEFWLGDVWELDGTGESLVFLGIVVLEHDLFRGGKEKKC
jgi:hypothetical protein